MSSRLRTTTGKISVVDGAWQERARNLAVVEGAALIPWGRDRGSLYVVIEAVGDPAQRESVYEEVISTIRRAHSKSHGSVTSGLREAIKQANSCVFQRNLDVLPNMRVIAGVTCAVLKDEDVYIGQSGPALSYVFRDGTLHRFPVDKVGDFPDSFQAAAGSYPIPLGAARRGHIDLFHSQIRHGDAILLCTTGLKQLMSDETLAEVLSNEDVGEILGALEASTKSGDLSAIVIRVEEDMDVVDETASDERLEEDVSPQRRVWGRLQERLRAGVLSSSLEEAELEYEGPEPLLERQEEEFSEPSTATVSEPASDESSLVEEADRGPGYVEPVGEPAGPGPSQREDLEWADVSREVEPDDEDLGGAITRPIRRGLMEEAEWRAWLTKFAAYSRDILRGAQTTLGIVGRGMASLLRRTLPGREVAPQKPVSAPVSLDNLRHNKLMVVGMLIPVFVALLLIVALVMRVQSQGVRFEALVESARDLNATGNRRSLIQALEQIDEALALRPDDPDARELRNAIRASLDEVQGVKRLYWFDTLWEFKDEMAHPDRLLMADGVNIYVLDRGLGRWHKFLLDGMGNLQEQAVLTKTGDTWEESVVGELLDILQVDSGRGQAVSTVACLTRDGLLLEYNPLRPGLKPIPVVQAGAWKDPKAAVGQQGTFYLLDAGQGKVLQYISANGAFDNPPLGYLDPIDSVDLADAVDLAIDGDLWVLKSDGLILKLQDGKRLLFDRAGLEEPLSDPTAIFTSADVKSIYVADAAGERIVQFSKEGRYERQLRCREGQGTMKDLRDILVDEARGKIYFLAGNVLREANLPAMEPEGAAVEVKVED